MEEQLEDLTKRIIELEQLAMQQTRLHIEIVQRLKQVGDDLKTVDDALGIVVTRLEILEQ